nr:hypothetical protein KPHV_11740 [Kitasatospora purpeofusca]
MRVVPNHRLEPNPVAAAVVLPRHRSVLGAARHAPETRTVTTVLRTHGSPTPQPFLTGPHPNNPR